MTPRMFASFSDELEKIAMLGEAVAGGGRAAVLAQNAAKAKSMLAPTQAGNAKAWFQRMSGPGGPITMPGQQRAAPALRTWAGGGAPAPRTAIGGRVPAAGIRGAAIA